MADDPEVEAMKQLNESLTTLDEPARQRVMIGPSNATGQQRATVAVAERVTEHVSTQRPVASAAKANAQPPSRTSRTCMMPPIRRQTL